MRLIILHYPRIQVVQLHVEQQQQQQWSAFKKKCFFQAPYYVANKIHMIGDG